MCQKSKQIDGVYVPVYVSLCVCIPYAYILVYVSIILTHIAPSMPTRVMSLHSTLRTWKDKNKQTKYSNDTSKINLGVIYTINETVLVSISPTRTSSLLVNVLSK